MSYNINNNLIKIKNSKIIPGPSEAERARKMVLNSDINKTEIEIIHGPSEAERTRKMVLNSDINKTE